VLSALVSSKQIRHKQASETVCTDGRVPDKQWSKPCTNVSVVILLGIRSRQMPTETDPRITGETGGQPVVSLTVALVTCLTYGIWKILCSDYGLGPGENSLTS